MTQHNAASNTRGKQMASKNLKQDAYGSDLSHTAVFGFNRSPAGKFAGKFTIAGRAGRVWGNVGLVVNRGKKAWGVVIVERDVEVDEELKAEWAAEGITGTPISVAVSVEIPAATARPPTPGRRLSRLPAKRWL